MLSEKLHPLIKTETLNSYMYTYAVETFISKAFNNDLKTGQTNSFIGWGHYLQSPWYYHHFVCA